MKTTIYLSDRNKFNLDNYITPANTFRVVYNNCFDGDYEILDNKHYYTFEFNEFLFTDITDRLKSIYSD